MPVISEGIRSGVNWIRRKDRSIACARVETSSRLGQAGHALHHAMPAGEDGDENFLDDPFLPDDDLGQLCPQSVIHLRKELGRLHVGVSAKGGVGVYRGGHERV